MISFFYNIIIFPLVQLIELVYLFVYRVFENHGIALLGVSAAVSVSTMPLYFIAEKHQQAERDIQKRLKPKINMIKAVFKGDEQYMLLSTYYRQNHYHPVYALRNTFGLLIQIPFFIAAYTYLSQLSSLKGVPLAFIKDLSSPDEFLLIGNFRLNLLPILMTAINCIAGAIYTKGLEIKDKVQLYSMAFVFLLLLYNSPAGLVLYWTMNNLFSLVKNILQRTENQKKVVYIGLCFLVSLLDAYLLILHSGYIIKRLMLCVVFSMVFFIPYLTKLYNYFKQKIKPFFISAEIENPWSQTFFISAISLFLLSGVVIPGSLIASAVGEFSFIESRTTPFPFLFYTTVQAAGIFLFWPICLYFLFSRKVRIFLSFFITLFLASSLVNTFLIPDNFGFLTITLIFSEPQPFTSNYKILLGNIGILILILILTFAMLFTRKKAVIKSFNYITLLALSIFSIFNIITISNNFSQFQKLKSTQNSDFELFQPIYSFSQNGKNVVLIMLDKAIPGYIPYIFDENPNLLGIFSDFTWYPNCISFAGHTLAGAPPIYGGYEYAPLEINKRDTVSIIEKHKEAFLLLPIIFANLGYSTVVTDPPFDNNQVSNLSIFRDFPQVHAENIIGKYSTPLLQMNPGVTGLSISNVLQNNLIRFSFFKITPFIFRYFVYDDGEWLTTSLDKFSKLNGSLTDFTIDYYACLNFLKELTILNNKKENNLNIIYNGLTHDPSFLQAPDYKLAQRVTNKGNGHFNNSVTYHGNIASFILLEKWFTYLKENGVYDNTRIIIVSDHGGNIFDDFENNIVLPDGKCLESYTALLMVKDFNSKGTGTALQVDNSFMINADVPLLATKDIITNPVNPFTNIPLKTNKENGVTITTIDSLSSRDHSKYKYKIRDNQWLFVQDNIFDPKNWKAVTVP
ncbi:inner membrane protein [Treponema primitia ZAS-2]|uniref:Inner membrane protein n=1 Tax=Treponema primitia (strain ATCC BAA-887 / DSM 12427 / ZAS-2) TaxID=545694 RepID=F5YHH7_TREPZ|nr:YidC/Oxa1 family membrane protein insertase [Treponema primitia]AEF86899.1 inner membrane protein [Treponema primitia ZAS-2]